MIQHPTFKPHIHVETIEGEGVFLLSEEGEAVLHGRLFQLVAPYIDGHRSADDIVDQLQDHVSAAEVYYTLIELETKGYVTENGQTFGAGEEALWTIQGVNTQTAAHRLDETSISVNVFGNVAIEPFLAVLNTLHIRVSEKGQLGVVLVDHYLQRGLEVYNEEALRDGRTWMLIKPVGCQIWVGPVFRTGSTGCWACLTDRLRTSRILESYVWEKNSHAEPVAVARSFTPATLQIAWNLAATEIAKFIVFGESVNLDGKVLTLDTRSWQLETHTLVQLPDCRACGSDSNRPGQDTRPVLLGSRRKTFTLDGGHRVSSPEATLERYEHHVSPISGAVNWLKRISPSSDRVMHVYTAKYNLGTWEADLRVLRRGLSSYSSGKGASDSQAKASALCEALERYSGVFRGYEPRRRARFKDLGDAGIHPNACMLFSEDQYQQRDEWNTTEADFAYVPCKFEENAVIDWTGVWSLTAQEVRYLPTSFCYYDYPQTSNQSYCISCSNGNAAGNVLEEAILQGFFELVERDSVALWWYNRVRRPAVDLKSFGEPYLTNVSAYLHDLNRDLWALDLTADLDIPTFVALSRRTDQQREEIMIGFGAHMDPRVAMLRAVTEIFQSLVVDVNRVEGKRWPLPSAIENWNQSATLANQPYLVPDESKAARVASDYPWRWTDDLREDVLACQAFIEHHGMEMLVLDQTRAEIGLPVVKVIVPGLRHFWARFAPGRLYEVPVKLGWLKQPLREEQLNPIPMFI